MAMLTDSQLSLRDAALQYHPFSGRISVYLFGRPEDWNFGDKGGDRDGARMRIGEMASVLGIQDVYAPVPSKFNAEVCTPADLQEEIPLGSDVTMWRGCEADGVEVPPGGMFTLASADCVALILHHEESGETIAAHGGRDCLIDKGRLNGNPRRQHESVIHAMVEDRFPRRERKHLRVFMTCGIGPENFSHPCDHEQYGASNTRMMFDILSKWGPTCLWGNHYQGNICLTELVRAQLISLHVPAHHIHSDGVETFNDRGPDGDYRWWSNRRGDTQKRNLVLVVRNW